MDPTYFLAVAPIHTMAIAYWDRWVPREWILRVWTGAVKAVTESERHFFVVDSPVAAAAASCRRFGWFMSKVGAFTTQAGLEVHMDDVCPRTIRDLAF